MDISWLELPVNLMMLLEMANAGHPDRAAVSIPGQTAMTFAELHARAGAGAADLQRRGASHVAYLGTNSPAFPVAVFAAAWAGIPFIPVNYRLTAKQISAILGSHENLLVIADPAFTELTMHRYPTLASDNWLISTASRTPSQAWPSDSQGSSIVLYTSGTTSAPKAAVLRHRHLVSYVFGSVDFGSASEAAAALIAVPPYHVAGIANLISNLYAGRRVVYLEPFTARTWLDTVRRERITHAMVVPTMLARIVAALEGATDAGAPTLQTLAYGGSRAAPSTVARALELFPRTGFVNAYGLTETSSTIAVLGPADHRRAAQSDDPAVRARLGSAGQLIPGIEGEIRDERGRRLPAGKAGELWLRGPQISGEYLFHTPSLDLDGWFRTGDRAHFDAAGYLYIEGRMDDTIIRGGENISPIEIEEVLIQHPEVADAAAVGIADDEWGQRIAAVIVARHGTTPDPDDVKAFARTHLRTAQSPDEIAIWPGLPYTDTGKLLRRQVRDWLEDERSHDHAR